MNAEDTQRVLENAFSLEFLRAKLTQKRDESPVVYTGPGSITQQNDGSLTLKLYHLFESSAELLEDVKTTFGGSEKQPGKIIFGVNELQPGQIIEDHHYFDFEGVDLFGFIWTSSRIWVSGNISLPSSGKVVTASLQSIETLCESKTEHRQETVRAQLYIPGKFGIPYFKPEQQGSSIHLSVCELSISGRSCILRKSDSHLEIIADLTGETNPDEHLDLILEGLSISIGCYLRPRLKKVNRLGQQIQVIYSPVKDEGSLKLPPPIPTSRPHNAENLQTFLGMFIEAIGECHSPLVGYWFRVLQAFAGDVENSALVLTTSIEGLLKDYYSGIGGPDEEFLKQLKDAKPLIKALSVEERVKNYIMSTLGNAKRTSPKNSLYALAQTNLFSENMVALWTKLRNKSTHADGLKFETHELQAFIDELHGCLELFYRLVLGKIGYSGEIVQYSVTGWPETKLSAVT